MLKLEFTPEELTKIEYNKEVMKNILVSRAIYNESYNYDFTDGQLEDLRFLENNEAIKLYMKKTVEPRVLVTENSIIDRYNANKEFFEANKISFKDAHEIIKNQLNQEVNYGLEQDLVKKLVHNMEDEVSLPKKDILFTKGDPELLKAILLNALLRQEANKGSFFEDNKEELDTIYKEVRIQYFVKVNCSKEINITQEEVSKFYVDHTKNFENMDINEAYQSIANLLYQQELDKRVNAYIQEISKKYKLDEEVEKYFVAKDIVN